MQQNGRKVKSLKEFVIAAADDGKKLEKWLTREMPAVGMGLRRKYFRLKRYKLNGRPAREDARLSGGDLLQIYLNDEEFEKPRREDPFLSKIRPNLSILYEDGSVLLADKRPGLMAHPDAHEKVNTLITHVQAYLYQKGQYDPSAPGAFAPALCNRLDRFTGGIEIVAKTEAAMRVLNRKIRDREIEKYYYCIALGRFARAEGVLDNYIVKSPEAKKVSVSPRMAPNGQRAQTKYRVLAHRDGLSLVECELLTGRTHQIRAQLAHAGHPLLGDNQYGDRRRNAAYGRGFQALYAYKLKFAFTSDAGEVNGLNGQTFAVRDVRFIREYFPEFEA